MATKDDQRLTPYSSKADIPIDNWLNLYEIICDHFRLRTDEAKITRLMAYLKEDALHFFATAIAPERTSLTWDEVRQKLEKRFGSEETEPLTTAIHRRLKREESIKQYYDSKLPLLHKTGMTVNAMCAALTDGLPHSYKSHFYGRRFGQTLDWLRLASDIEVDVNTNPFRPQQQTRKPPYPCRFCQELGRTEIHWHNECPNHNRKAVDNTSEDEQNSEEEEEQPTLHATNTGSQALWPM